ncbi:MAG: hypothetical protein JXN59_00300 [Anaerolineae bacterium]|nr:hypothetical protein [Anaerolineae bacterium]
MSAAQITVKKSAVENPNNPRETAGFADVMFFTPSYLTTPGDALANML